MQVRAFQKNCFETFSVRESWKFEEKGNIFIKSIKKESDISSADMSQVWNFKVKARPRLD